jgi:hypothetical protein
MISPTRRMGLAVVVAIALAAFHPVAAFAKKQSAPSLAVPVVGTVTNAAGSFAGTLTVKRFVARGNQVFAIGTVSGLLTTATGATSIVTVAALPVTVATVPVTVPAPLNTAQVTCNVLNLVLGPLHLNLLGLVVDLNQVVLNITAEAGGGLLGNLLCAIAGLLGNPAGLASSLNDLLGALV